MVYPILMYNILHPTNIWRIRKSQFYSKNFNLHRLQRKRRFNKNEDKHLQWYVFLLTLDYLGQTFYRKIRFSMDQWNIPEVSIGWMRNFEVIFGNGFWANFLCASIGHALWEWVAKLPCGIPFSSARDSHRWISRTTFKDIKGYYHQPANLNTWLLKLINSRVI